MSNDEGESTACKVCGAWQCLNCGRKSYRANRFSIDEHRCACGSTKGKMLPVKHQNGFTGRDHNEEYDWLIQRGRTPRYPLEDNNDSS